MNFTDKLKEAIRNRNIEQVRLFLEEERSAYATDVTPLLEAAYFSRSRLDPFEYEKTGPDVLPPEYDILELLLKELLRPLSIPLEQEEDMHILASQALEGLIHRLEQGETGKDPTSVANYFAGLNAVHEWDQLEPLSRNSRP